MANNPYVNKVVFGSATLVDLTGTTATADKILSGYGAFGADGAWMDGTATSGGTGGNVWQDAQGYVHLDDEGGGSSSVTVEALSVTQNGTYTAPTGKAYSPVTVNVSGGGGATNIVQGTFTAGTAGTVQTINVPYTGNGYPIELNISVNGGTHVNNSGDTNAQTWYDAIHQYAIGKYSMSKCGATNAPVYSGSNVFIDGGTVTSVYKNSSSNNNSYTRGYVLDNLMYESADPTAGSATTVTIPSNTSFKVLVSEATSGYGFLSGLVYSYYVVYSE